MESGTATAFQVNATKHELYKNEKHIKEQIEEIPLQENDVICPEHLKKKIIKMKFKYKKFDAMINKIENSYFSIDPIFGRFGFMSARNIKVIEADYIFIARYNEIHDIFTWIWSYALTNSDLEYGNIEEIVKKMPKYLEFTKERSFRFKNQDLLHNIIFYIDKEHHFDTVHHQRLNDGFVYLFGLTNMQQVNEKSPHKIPQVLK